MRSGDLIPPPPTLRNRPDKPGRYLKTLAGRDLWRSLPGRARRIKPERGGGIYSHAPRASIETLNHIDTLARYRDMLRAPSSLYREDGARYGILWYQVNIDI